MLAVLWQSGLVAALDAVADAVDFQRTIVEPKRGRYNRPSRGLAVMGLLLPLKVPANLQAIWHTSKGGQGIK